MKSDGSLQIFDLARVLDISAWSCDVPRPLPALEPNGTQRKLMETSKIMISSQRENLFSMEFIANEYNEMK